MNGMRSLSCTSVDDAKDWDVLTKPGQPATQEMPVTLLDDTSKLLSIMRH